MSKSKQKAVALKYNSDQDLAPVVIASGYGHVAERIIDIAEQRGIPVYRDDSASSMLCMLEVGASIPEELYEIVAAIYCQILTTAAKLKNGDNNAVRGAASAARKDLETDADQRETQRTSENGGGTDAENQA